MADPLFALRNSFYLGAFQTCISECSNATGLSESQKIERDVFLYRSYIELGTYDVRGAGRAAATPQPPADRCSPLLRRASSHALRLTLPLPPRSSSCLRSTPPRPWRCKPSRRWPCT